MLLVLMDTLSIVKERMLTLFGYLNAPHDHAEISFSDVVPGDGLMLGEGRRFEIAKVRLGPGHIQTGN